jgi:hypothetical protein
MSGKWQIRELASFLLAALTLQNEDEDDVGSTDIA